MPPRPGKGGQSPVWIPGRPADEDAETARILASYSPELLQPVDIAVLLGQGDHAVAENKLGLELIARARIETIPDSFSSSLLLAHIRDWQSDLQDWEIGPEPRASERKVLINIEYAARRLTTALNDLKAQMSLSGSRIANSTFAAHWDQVRLDRLRRELDDLRNMAGSPEVTESMRREDRPLKPKGGWSTREALYGTDIPELYTRLFGRPYTASGKADAFPSEGVRFVCVIATEIVGCTVSPENVVRQKTSYRRARGGKHGEK